MRSPSIATYSLLEVLEMYYLCSHMHPMARRNSAHNLRQAISEILEQTSAIEHAMDLHYRKGSERDLARANDDLKVMLAAVDRLSAIIAAARRNEAERPRVAEPAAL